MKMQWGNPAPTWHPGWFRRSILYGFCFHPCIEKEPLWTQPRIMRGVHELDVLNKHSQNLWRWVEFCGRSALMAEQRPPSSENGSPCWATSPHSIWYNIMYVVSILPAKDTGGGTTKHTQDMRWIVLDTTKEKGRRWTIPIFLWTLPSIRVQYWLEIYPSV